MTPRCKLRQRRLFGSSPLFACLALLTLNLSLTTNASAVGFGPFFEYSHGNGKLDANELFGTRVFSVNHLDIESDKYAVGIAIDTNVAANRLFNYRLNLGFQRTHRDLDDLRVTLPQFPATAVVKLNDIDASGFTFNNDFGFGLLRTDSLRLWIGPSLRFNLDVYDTDLDDFDVLDLSVGVGASLGVNIHAGPLVSLAFTTGYQYVFISELVQYENTNGERRSEVLDGYEHVVKAGVTVFFRTPGDRF